MVDPTRFAEALPRPSAFATAMSRHWEQDFGNTASPALRSVWSQIADTFNRQVHAHGTSQEERWPVVQAPTGTGKTQGLAVYCSLLPEVDHPGVLIVVRLKIQADEIAQTINRLTGRQDALAYHGDNKVPVDTFKEFPVLVITHRAYEIGMDKVNQGLADTSNWTHYHAWSLDGRKLVVIDEALDIVEEAQVDLERVKLVRAVIPESITQKYPNQMGALGFVEDVLRGIARIAQERADVKAGNRFQEFERVLWNGRLKFPEEGNLTPLRLELRNIRLDRSLFISDPDQKRRAVASLDTILRDVQATLENWYWYAKKLSDHTLNTARLIVPDSIKGAVVLDATASSDVVYQLFDKAEVIPLPAEKARTYRNVTLHVSRGHAVGKVHLVKHAEEEASKLVENLRHSLPADRRVFVVTQQGVEPVLVKYRDASGFQSFDVGHYGALDGRNDWREYDTAVIFGLPFRDKPWSANTYMALQGLQTTAWLNAEGNRPFKQYEDVRRALEVGKLVVAVVQAINRIRCRRVINADGDCPTADVFLLLPPGKLGDEILAGIEREMPGLLVKDWQYDRLKRAKPGRKANVEDALVRLAAILWPGKYTAPEIRERLGGISSRHWFRLAHSLTDPDSPLSQALAALGVHYSVKGNKGSRGSVAYLVKE